MKTKKVKKNMIHGACFVVLFWMSCVALLFWIVLLKTNHMQWIFEVMAGLCCICFVLEIMTYFMQVHTFKRWMERMQQMPEDINQAIFHEVDSHYALAEQWLVYHRGNLYMPFYKDSIGAIQYDGHHIRIQEKQTHDIFVYKANNNVYHALLEWAK